MFRIFNLLCALFLLGTIVIPQGADAEAGCLNPSQSPLWKRTLKDEGLHEIFRVGDLMYMVTTGHISAGNSYPARLKIADISNVMEPVDVGYFDIILPDGNPIYSYSELTVYENLALVCTQGYMLIFDVSDPANIIERGHIYWSGSSLNGVGAMNDVVVVSREYLNSNNHYVSVFDISDPDNPTFLDSESASGSGTVAMKGDFAYVPNGFMGLAVYNLADPTNVITIHDGLGSDYCFGVVIDGDRAYTTGDNFLTVYDISDPLVPEILQEMITFNGLDMSISDSYLVMNPDYNGVISLQRNPDGTLLQGGMGYSSGFCNSVIAVGDVIYSANLGSGLQIFEQRVGVDYLDMSSIISGTSTYDYKGSVLKGDHLAILGNSTFNPNSEKMFFYDISDPDNTVLEVSLDTSAEAYGNNYNNIAISGDFLCVPNQDNGLLIYDWSDLANPFLTATVDPSEPVLDVFCSGDMAFASVGTAGIMPVRLSTTSTPLMYPPFSVPGTTKACYVDGNRLFAITDDTLWLAMVSSPLNPVIGGSLELGQIPRALTAWGDFVYVTGKNKLFVVDVSDPMAPFLTGTLLLPWSNNESEYCRDIILDYPRVIISQTGAAIQVVDVQDPSHPELLGKYYGTNSETKIQMKDESLLILLRNHFYLAEDLCEVLTAVNESPIPGKTQLELEIFPNPFNPRTTIAFDLQEARLVRLDIYDLAGKKVSSLAAGEYGPGRHQISWQGVDDSGRALASGLYLARLKAGDLVVSHSMALIR